VQRHNEQQDYTATRLVLCRDIGRAWWPLRWVQSPSLPPSNGLHICCNDYLPHHLQCKMCPPLVRAVSTSPLAVRSMPAAPTVPASPSAVPSTSWRPNRCLVAIAVVAARIGPKCNGCDHNHYLKLRIHPFLSVPTSCRYVMMYTPPVLGLF